MSKMTSKCQDRYADVIHEVVLHPPRIRRKFPERVKIAENFIRYARNKYKRPVVRLSSLSPRKCGHIAIDNLEEKKHTQKRVTQ